MKTLLTFLIFTSLTYSQSHFGLFQFVDREYTQFTIWNDPVVTFDKKMPQFGIELTKVMNAGWASVSISTAALNVPYEDLIFSGGINFHAFNYDPVRYYVGPRAGFILRDGAKVYPMVGGVIGFDWRITRWNSPISFHVGATAGIDYREDQKNKFFGDSSAYEPGLITNNPLLQENGQVKFSISW